LIEAMARGFRSLAVAVASERENCARWLTFQASTANETSIEGDLDARQRL
jgi:hypothetical protein